MSSHAYAGERVRVWMMSSRVSPSRNSITMYDAPSRVTPRSWVSTTWAWAMRAAARASATKRQRMSSFSDSSSCSILSATRLPTSTFSASYTIPVAPNPSVRLSSYLPSTRLTLAGGAQLSAG